MLGDRSISENPSTPTCDNYVRAHFILIIGWTLSSQGKVKSRISYWSFVHDDWTSPISGCTNDIPVGGSGPGRSRFRFMICTTIVADNCSFWHIQRILQSTTYISTLWEGFLGHYCQDRHIFGMRSIGKSNRTITDLSCSLIWTQGLAEDGLMKFRVSMRNMVRPGIPYPLSVIPVTHDMIFRSSCSHCPWWACIQLSSIMERHIWSFRERKEVLPQDKLGKVPYYFRLLSEYNWAVISSIE